MLTPIKRTIKYIDNIFILLMFKLCDKNSYEGMVLYAIDEKEEFFTRTQKALDLIKQYDPRRFRRVIAHLEAIAYIPTGYNHYSRRHKAFFVDAMDTSSAYFAASIIHEATHGYLNSKGFAYLKEKRFQHERICVSEELRFLKKMIANDGECSEDEKKDRISVLEKHYKESLRNQWWDKKNRRKRMRERLKELLSGK